MQISGGVSPLMSIVEDHLFIFFLFLFFLLLKCFTLQNKAYHKTKTKDDTYNIADTNKKKRLLNKVRLINAVSLLLTYLVIGINLANYCKYI